MSARVEQLAASPVVRALLIKCGAACGALQAAARHCRNTGYTEAAQIFDRHAAALEAAIAPVIASGVAS